MQLIKTIVFAVVASSAIGCAQASPNIWQVQSPVNHQQSTQQVQLTATLGMYDPEYQGLALQKATQECQSIGFSKANVIKKAQQCEIYNDAGCAKTIFTQSYQCQ